MSHDGLPVRAPGARAAVADRPMKRPRLRGVGAVAATGLAALAVAACGSSGSSGSVAGATGTPAPTAPTESAMTSPEASPSAAAATKVGLIFKEANSSKITGGGSVIDLGDGSSVVTIGIVAIGFDKPMPATLTTGTCSDAIAAPVPSAAPASPEASGGTASAAPTASPSPAAAGSAEPSLAAPSESVAPTPATLPVALTAVKGGVSNTVVQITAASLLSSPSAVVVHKSDADLTVVACADVTSTPLPSLGTLQSALPGLESALPSIAAGIESAMPSTAP